MVRRLAAAGARPLLTASQIAGARFSSGRVRPPLRRQGLSPSAWRARDEPVVAATARARARVIRSARACVTRSWRRV